MKLMHCLKFTLLFLSSGVIASDIDYVKLEDIARNAVCSKTVCQDVVMVSAATGPFVVDGITLPSNALRDIEQQQSVVSLGMYIDENGDVLTLDEPASQSASYQPPTKNKSLPIKIFPPAVISHTESQPVIIGIN